VLVLHQGRLLADGTPAAVTTALGGATLEEAFIRRHRRCGETAPTPHGDCCHAHHPCCFAAACPGRAAAAGRCGQGTAYVSSEKDHALSVVDLKTQAVTGTIATCKRPRHLQRSPDGKLLMVACGDSGRPT
jgi:hypothetical protein